MSINEYPPPKETAPAVLPTEQIVSDIRNICSHYKPPLEEQERQTAHKLLHETLDHFENHAMKELYDNAQVPTFASIERAIEQTKQALEKEEGDEEAEKLAKLLTNRIKEIKQWSRRYVEVLIRFQQQKKRAGTMDAWKEADALERVDKDRRRVHDALLESLRVLEQLLLQAHDHLGTQRPATWESSVKLPQGYAKEHPLTFSSKAIADRVLIMQWAIIADSIEQIKEVVGE